MPPETIVKRAGSGDSTRARAERYSSAMRGRSAARGARIAAMKLPR